ncbi:hypothetical protein OS493_007180 [Desmophyllum pertusum]|uniref:Uncharacterized protein n=1 Tax=Desmophyllum pertusum TaxID=174260 RepID=A0A9W9ZHS6_9CNID|nr:hypothetical protein OS493_007180 [Desmophyllum pertusum]
MAFAKDYREEITLAYYCFYSALTIAMFIVGTIFLRNRDRRDEQRREWRQFEERISREWRQFAEKISSEYSKLKAEGIPRKISKVKDNFEKLSIIFEITGVDVLRYMLDDDNRQHFKTTQLENLREDLQSIFQLFNVCSSLLLLGKVPKNIKEELKDLVTDLGEMTYPLFKGERRKIILKCVEHFGNSRRDPETERRSSELDARLEEAIPYLNNLRFGTFNLDYSECSNFSLNVTVTNQVCRQADLTFLITELHKDLEDTRYMTDFATKWREQQPTPFFNLIDPVNRSDTDEDVHVKFLHEVRVYIHLFLNEDKLVQYHEQITVIMITLRDVSKEVKEIRPTEVIVKETCERLIEDLQSLHSSPPHCNSQEFCDKLTQLKDTLCEIQIIR